MHIGITYDLRDDYLAQGFSELQAAEFDSIVTIDAIEAVLQELGHSTDRIGSINKLVERLAAGARWDLVFNIAEGVYGLAREAQVPALLDAYAIPYTFSDATTMCICQHKAHTKRMARAMGIATPDFAVVESIRDIDALTLPYPLFAKPLAEGTSKGVDASSRITEEAGLRAVCAQLLRDYHQPVLVETYLPGREFTVGILGTGPDAQVIGVLEIVLGERAEPDAYTYHNKVGAEADVVYRLEDDEAAQSAAALALKAWRAFGCRDGGRIDIREDAAGVPQLIEINPLAGLRPGYSDLPLIWQMQGRDYKTLIEIIVQSATKRYGS